MREVNREPAIADCDPEVYEKGVSVCLVSIPKETAEVICQNITAATGCKVDWHYFGGRVHIKALRAASQSAPVVIDDTKLRELFDSWFASDCSFDLSPEASEADNIAWRESYWYVWQRCRAAMLNQK